MANNNTVEDIQGRSTFREVASTLSLDLQDLS